MTVDVLPAQRVPVEAGSATESSWDLVRRAKEGDDVAFDLLTLRHRDAVYQYVHSRVGEITPVADLVLNTFVKARQEIGGFRPVTDKGGRINDIPGRWLRSIARELVNAHLASTDDPRNNPDAEASWELVQRAQQGDTEAFGQIYKRYADTVFRFAHFRVGNRDLAEDVTSDTFLRALKRIDSFTWQGRDLGAWLVTIARNLIVDHFKSGRYRMEVLGSHGDALGEKADGAAFDGVDRSPEANPESTVVDHITNVALLTAVKKLNPEQRECIVLRFLQQRSVAEVAAAMGKNEGAIKALQYRAVRALARDLPEGFLAGVR